MSENKSVESEPHEAKSESGTASNESSNPTLNKSQAINLCATGLLICFFLPWGHTIIGDLSGFDLQKVDEYHKVLWLIPISCVIAIVAGLARQPQKSAALFAGVLPFLALAYWTYQIGFDTLKGILGIGAYFGLGLAFVLIVLSLRSK